MKSLSWLTEKVLADAGTRCGAAYARDIIEVSRRVEHEGDSFLTITLPDYCKGFEIALDSGLLQPKHMSSFRWHKRGLPEFLRGFLLQIFHLDGRILAEPSIEAIACVRQICLLHKKVLRDCTPVRQRRSSDAFRKCENEVEAWSKDPPKDAIRVFREVSRVVWSSLMAGVPFGDPRPEIKPRHGPGSTAEAVLGNSKYKFQRWHRRLEEYFPFTEYGIASVRNVGDATSGVGEVDFVEPEDEQPVRVCFVPKTQKAPRVIAIEPVCQQYIQQAIMHWLVPRIERGVLTAGRINFTDQSVNAKLALASSANGQLATVDMSEASDRVSSYLVRAMLEAVPLFSELVFSCRSTRALLPEGDIVTLQKFASMGSALCFPMEAMVFFIAIVSGRILRLNRTVSTRLIYQSIRDVYVYGDDLLFPADEAPAICDHLESLGLKVNYRKSFWTGKFRESCGTDAYDGEVVTPIYSQHDVPTDRRDVDPLVSFVAMANRFYAAGFWITARALRETVEDILGALPFLSETAAGLHWNSYSNWIQCDRWDKELMTSKVKTWVPRTVYRSDPLDGDPALLKWFHVGGNRDSNGILTTTADHLQRVVARGKLALSRRWISAY